jgi:protein-disulfide isomerase/uncharacterized membrane protein
MLKRSTPIALLALSLAGLFLGLMLTSKHFDLNHAPPGPPTAILGFDGMCGDGGGCAEVNTSKYAKISLGEDRIAVPVSIPAVGFFFMMAILAAASLRTGSPKREKYLAVAAACFVPALAFSLYLLGVQALILGKFCVYCLGLDTVTVLAACWAYLGHGGGIAGILRDLKSPPRNLIIILAFAMLIANYKTYQLYSDWIEVAEEPADDQSTTTDKAPTRSPQEEQQALSEARKAVAEFIASYPAIEALELPTNVFDGTKGTLDAGVVVTEFADFECPHCKLAGFYVKDIAHRYGDRVGFVFKNYPLGTDCNDNLKRDVHPDSCEAAIGVQCAKRQGAFWPFHDSTFNNQGALGRSKLLSIASQLKLDVAAFEECLEKDSLLDEVREQVAQGRNAGLSGTPTFFVNGKLLPSSHPLFVEAAIRWELAELGEMQLPEDIDGVFPR